MKKHCDIKTYLRGDNSVDMVPPPLANGGSNSTISDLVLSCHMKYFKGGIFLYQMISVYCKTIYLLFILNASNISRVWPTFHLIFMRLGLWISDEMSRVRFTSCAEHCL